MPVYLYKAVTSSGLIVKNRVEEINKQTLVKKLKRNDLLPITIIQLRGGRKMAAKKTKRNMADINSIMETAATANILQARSKRSTREKLELLLDNSRKVTSRDLIVFTQNFYLLKKANFNNIHALSTIIQSTENLRFREILQDILAGVEGGDNMYTTMEYYSDIFPYIYVNMVKVGELSGTLTDSLQQAVKYLEDSGDLTRKVKKILVPNIIQFALLLVLLIVGTLIAIPAIQNVFDAVGSTAQLPAITLWFQDFINKVIEYWYIPTVIIAVAVAGVIFYINTPKGKYNFHYFKYKMPIFGKLIFAIDFSRLMKAMLLNLQNGLRIQEALEVSKNIIQNYVLLSIVETAINNILIGESWIEPFEKSGLTTPMMTEMLKIGMQTDLAGMMEKLVDYMQIDIDQLMDKIMAVLPQVVYAIVGVVLIFFVLVVLVPCIQVYMGNFMFEAYDI